MACNDIVITKTVGVPVPFIHDGPEKVKKAIISFSFVGYKVARADDCQIRLSYTNNLLDIYNFSTQTRVPFINLVNDNDGHPLVSVDDGEPLSFAHDLTGALIGTDSYGLAMQQAINNRGYSLSINGNDFKARTDHITLAILCPDWGSNPKENAVHFTQPPVKPHLKG